MAAEGLAARLAPEVDRLALCVHRPAGQRPEFREAAAGLPLPAGSFAVTAARQLSAGRVTLAELELLSRYQSRSVVAEIVRLHVEQGLVVDRGGTYEPSPAFRALSRLALLLQAEAAASLWAAQRASLPELTNLAERLVAAGRHRPAGELPAFASQVAHHDETPAGPPGQLLARLTELRYLRSDVHSAVLARRGLAGPRAQALARLWHGHPVEERHGAALASRGLAVGHDDAWELTPQAHDMRSEVESETDRDNDEILGPVLTASEQGRMLKGLGRLAGEDPRPPEDR